MHLDDVFVWPGTRGKGCFVHRNLEGSFFHFPSHSFLAVVTQERIGALFLHKMLARWAGFSSIEQVTVIAPDPRPAFASPRRQVWFGGGNSLSGVGSGCGESALSLCQLSSFINIPAPSYRETQIWQKPSLERETLALLSFPLTFRRLFPTTWLPLRRGKRRSQHFHLSGRRCSAPLILLWKLPLSGIVHYVLQKASRGTAVPSFAQTIIVQIIHNRITERDQAHCMCITMAMAVLVEMKKSYHTEIQKG